MADEEKNTASEEQEAKPDTNAPQESEAKTGTSEEKPKPKKSAAFPIKKVLMIIVALAVLGGGGAGAYFFFMNDAHDEKESAPQNTGPKVLSPEQIVYYEFPEMLINLKSKNRRRRFLKALLILELEKQQDVALVEKLTPRITDRFQVYLRELRLNDIEGAGGMDRLRDELLTRLNKIMAPARVHNILFKEFLIQ